MISAVDVMEDILKFRGFWKASFVDKLKWVFVLYPFMLFVIGFYISLHIIDGVCSVIRKLIGRK